MGIAREAGERGAGTIARAGGLEHARDAAQIGIGAGEAAFERGANGALIGRGADARRVELLALRRIAILTRNDDLMKVLNEGYRPSQGVSPRVVPHLPALRGQPTWRETLATLEQLAEVIAVLEEATTATVE